MGVSSNTLHVRGDEPHRVARAYAAQLRRHGWRLRSPRGIPQYAETQDDPAFRRVAVSRSPNGWITIIDQQFDAQNLSGIDSVAAQMSRTLRAASVALVVHDSEALYLFAWERGRRLDRWCSWPGWYADAPPSPRARARWCAHPHRLLALCHPDTSLVQLRDIMRDYSQAPPDEPFVFPEDILVRLQDALGVEQGARTYAGLHAQPAALRLRLPGRRDPLQIERGLTALDDSPSLTHLHFVRL